MSLFGTTSFGAGAPGAPGKFPELAKQPPPIPFDRFISSGMFTVRAGPDLQAFNVHKDLLAGLSQEMRNHVYNDMKEGQENCLDLKHISPDTMHRFMEFCYSGDYLYATGAESKNDGPLRDEGATEALPLLMRHAKLYVFAEMFNIVSLKELSRKKIVALGASFGELENRIHGLAMISLIEYVLENIPVTSERLDELVKYLAGYAGYLINKLGQYPEFHAVLAGSAREDFFRVFFSWVTARRDRVPW